MANMRINSDENPPEGEQNEQIHQKTVVTQAMENIRILISSGLYKSGDKLPTEQELAKRFGIGRSSIREAIKIFQHLGILESRVPKGTFLCNRSHISSEAITWAILLGDNDMWEILELRQIIEEAAFRSLMTRRLGDEKSTRSTIGSLEVEIKNMQIGAEEGSTEKLIDADYTFHSIIINDGGNGLFHSIYTMLHSFLREEIRKTYQGMKNLQEVSKDHQEIIDAMQSGSLEKAVIRHSAHFHRIRGLLVPGNVS